MNSPHERIGWLESDLGALAKRVSEAEDSINSIEHGADTRKREKLETSDKLRDLQKEIHSARLGVANLNSETIDAVRILRERLDAQALAILVLGLIAGVEGLAIILLWWFR